MSHASSRIHTIIADKDTLTLQGEHAGASALGVYFLPPFEAVPDVFDRPADFTVSGSDLDSPSFSLTLDRYLGGQDRLFSQIIVASQHTTGPAQAIPGVRYANRFGDIAAYDYPYPSAPTIKGLQVRVIDDAIALGVRHAALNLNQGNIARSAPSADTTTFVMDGREFYFDEAYLKAYDEALKTLSDNGIVVTLILLNSIKWDGVEMHPDMREILLHPDYDPEGFISAFNVVTEEGLAHYRAFVEFVAQRYTRPDQKHGRACGFIIGNEVDAQWIWCNAGEKTLAEYVRQHGIAMRTAFYAARKYYAQARVYLSLTHHWTLPHLDNPLRAYGGRDIIETLNAQCQAMGDYDWSLAYHPYPQNLFHADFWRDAEAIDSLDTPRITFRNLQILPQYFAQPHLLYDDRMRHIILSEQGFHSDENEESERIQAAAYAFAYWKVLQSPAIESFILHAHVDNRDEFNLNLGIRRRDKSSDSPNEPGTPKPVYEIFRDIDGPRQAEIFAWAKTVVGEENWK